MKKVDKKVNLNVFITRTIISLFVYVGYILLIVIPDKLYEEEIVKTILLSLGGLIVFITLIFNFVLPFFIYKYHSYELKDEELLIHKGVIFRHVTHVPIKRIQHIQKMTGPIQILFNLSTVQVFTAGSADYIVGLNSLVANELIDDINSKLNKFLKEEESND